MDKHELHNRKDARVTSSGSKPVSLSEAVVKVIPEQFQLPETVEVKTGFLLKYEVPVGPKLLAIIMQAYAKNGICQIPQRLLCKITGVEKRTISRWLRQLVTGGIIAPVSKTRDEGKPVAYRLN